MLVKNIILLSVVAVLTACDGQQLAAPTENPVVEPVPDNWLEYQQVKTQQKTDYIRQHQIAYDWFADFAFSETDGVPYILLRLLPIIAPELWGSDENFLEVVGLFKDERQANYPMPRGIGLSVLARQDVMADIDYASFTCAACHIGRVKDDDGRIIYLDGGVNTEFNIVKYRVNVYRTLQTIYGEETNKKKRQQLAIAAFLEALSNAEKNSNTFFYRNYQNAWLHLDADYEKQQIALFRRNAEKTIIQFVTRAENEYTSYAALLKKNYRGFEEESLKGFPGMADATGISTTNGYSAAQTSFFSRLFSSHILPPTPGITDFMSVWEQGKRKAQWDDQRKTLINGGGQWNGNIPIPMYRNLAAQLTLGLNDNDIRVSAFAVELLDGLPASVYPFDVDVELAKKGQVLFTEHCADCHQPHNGKVYDNLGVNLDRSYVVNWIIRKGGIDGFYKACSPETTVDMAGKSVRPCAEFEGVSLEGKKSLVMSPNQQHHGYNARPLSGIWAQAPYLHNGSVPTIYHLLVPDERPDVFIKSRLEYDQQLLGFAWQPASGDDSLTQGYEFDTRSFSTFNHKGHDKDIKEGNKVYQLDWSDDKAGAMALIEYLKVL